MKKRYILGILMLLLVVGVGVMWVMLSHALPKGTPGPKADALAKAMQQASNQDAWDKTGAVTWHFGGRNVHLWDRKRSLSRVQWGIHEVLFPIGAPTTGIAKVNGKIVTNKTVRTKLLKKGYAFWCNDSFWLNPVDKLFDKGVVRKLVVKDGKEHLLAEFASGGVTPGDKYLYLLDDKKMMTAWYMYVRILPIKGLAASFAGWTTLSTGAKVSTRHSIGPMTLKLTNVKGAATLAGLVKPDPFALLFAGKQPKRRAAPATSRPVPRPTTRTPTNPPNTRVPTNEPKRPQPRSR